MKFYIAAQSDTLPNRLIDTPKPPKPSNVVKNTNAAIDGLFGIIESLKKSAAAGPRDAVAGVFFSRFQPPQVG